MLTQIKCPNCAEWNEYVDVLGKCAFCGNSLIKQETEGDRESIKRRKTPVDLRIPVYPDDNTIVRGIKHVLNFVQFVFLAVLSFFFWLIAASPG